MHLPPRSLPLEKLVDVKFADRRGVAAGVSLPGQSTPHSMIAAIVGIEAEGPHGTNGHTAMASGRRAFLRSGARTRKASMAAPPLNPIALISHDVEKDTKIGQ